MTDDMAAAAVEVAVRKAYKQGYMDGAHAVARSPKGALILRRASMLPPPPLVRSILASLRFAMPWR